jgi:uncharacterized protein YqgC (DUF456 family)
METIIFIGVLLSLLVGVAGVFLPVVPTPLLPWAGLLACHLLWTDGPVGGRFLLAASVLTLFAHGFEFAGGFLGAKWFGATWRGALGALVGGVVGPLVCFFIPLPFTFFLGLFAGPFVGALLGELLGKREWADATKSGIGTVLGNLASMLVKFAAALALLVGFLVAFFAPFFQKPLP